MKQKWISLAGFLVVMVGFLSTSPVANAQIFGKYGQWSNECPEQIGNWYGCGVGGCLYGQMVPDGGGGMIRAYGYPIPPCGGNLPCCCNRHGVGGRHCPNCPRNRLVGSRQRSSSPQANGALSSTSNRNNGAQAAFRTRETAGGSKAQPVGYAPQSVQADLNPNLPSPSPTLIAVPQPSLNNDSLKEPLPAPASGI